MAGPMSPLTPPPPSDWLQDLREHMAQEAATPSAGRAAALGFGAGATFNFLDELRGMAGAVTPRQGYAPASQATVRPDVRKTGESVIPPTPKDLKTQYPSLSYTDAYAQWYKDTRPDLMSTRAAEVDRAQRQYRYTTTRDAAREEATAAREAHPWAYGVPEAFGAMATTGAGAAMAGPSVAAKKLATTDLLARTGLGPPVTLAQRLGPGILGAAKVGAAYSAGSASELQDVPHAAMQGAIDTAKMQGVFGLAGPGVRMVTSKLAPYLAQLQRVKAAERIANLPEAERIALAEEEIAAARRQGPPAVTPDRRRNLPDAYTYQTTTQDLRPTGTVKWLLDRAREYRIRQSQNAPIATAAPVEPAPGPAIIATPEEMKKVAAVAKDAGGFTFDPARREYVRTGYALSTSPDKGVILPDIGGPSLAGYANRHESTFMRDPQAVAGGWRNPATGKWEIDVSRVIPNREEAMRQAAAAKQKAIYHLDTGETIPVPAQPGALTAGSERAPAASATAPEPFDPMTAAGFTAYHGSPHVYEGPPSLRHVGTGEDTLMEGYGTYATSKPEVGEWYRQMLTSGKPIQVTYKGRPPANPVEKQLGDMIHDNMRMGLFDDNNAAYSVGDAMLDLEDHLTERITADKQYLAKNLGRQGSDEGWGTIGQDVIAKTRKDLERHESMMALLKKSKAEDFQFSEPGAVYKWDVSEHAPLLDWSKSVKDQPQVHDALNRLRERIVTESPEVLEAGSQITKNYATPRLMDTLADPLKSDLSGRRLYENLYEHYLFQDPNQNAKLAMQRASQALSDAGLVGHRYVGKSSGVENYVVYNPERDVKPIERHPSLHEARQKNPNFARGGEVPHMANGGWTAPVPPAPLTTEDLIAQQQAAQTQVAAQEAARQAQLQDSMAQFLAQRGQPSLLPTPGVPAQATPALTLGPPAPAPAHGMTLLPSHGAAPVQQPQPAARPTPEVDPYSGILKFMAPPSGAVMAMGKAQQQQFQAEADLAGKQAAWSQEQMKWYADARSKIDADYNATVNDYRNSRIDPNRVFNDRTTGQKAMAMVGLLLGGIGSGITGQPNLAANMIQSQIERDIQAQVAEMDKKKNLVAINFERYGNLDAAVRATYMQQTAFYEAKLHQLTATSNAAQAVPQAQIAAFKLREPLIPMMLQLAQYQGLQNMIKSGGHVTGDMPAPWSWDQYMALAMPGPAGKTTFARSPEDRKAAVEKLQKWDSYSDAVDQLDRQRSGLAALSFLPTDAQHEYEQHREALIMQFAAASGLGGKEAIKIIEKIVPGNVQQFLYSKSLDALREIGSNGMWSVWETHGSLHNPRLQPAGSAGRAAARPVAPPLGASHAPSYLPPTVRDVRGRR